jgi:general secretion pathway protein H
VKGARHRTGIPPAPPPRARRRDGAGARLRAAGGFTLVEILLALAIVALIGSLLLPGVNSILRRIEGDDPDRVFWDVVTAAREQALTENRTVALRFDKENHLLVWGSSAGLQQKPLPAGVAVQFLQAKAGSTILLGGVLVESQEIPLVRFYPDGTCDRFRVQIRRGETAAPQIVAIDPWTCAPMPATENG